MPQGSKEFGAYAAYHTVRIGEPDGRPSYLIPALPWWAPSLHVTKLCLRFQAFSLSAIPLGVLIEGSKRKRGRKRFSRPHHCQTHSRRDMAQLANPEIPILHVKSMRGHPFPQSSFQPLKAVSRYAGIVHHRDPLDSRGSRGSSLSG
jgi:hypothetical protein